MKPVTIGDISFIPIEVYSFNGTEPYIGIYEVKTGDIVRKCGGQIHLLDQWKKLYDKNLWDTNFMITALSNMKEEDVMDFSVILYQEKVRIKNAISQ